MARYINADRLEIILSGRVRQLIGEHGSLSRETSDVLRLVQSEPSADVAPVIHAHWEQTSDFDEDNNVYVCSNCGEPWTIIDGTPADNNMHYCPKCGALMDNPTATLREKA